MAVVAGDIAFVGLNTVFSTTSIPAQQDQVAILAVNAIAGGDSFFITDGGFISATGVASTTFRASEGFIRYTAPAGGIAAGTVIVISTGDGNPATPPTVALNGGGDAGTVTSLPNSSSSTSSGNLTVTGEQLTAYTVSTGTHLTGNPVLIAFIDVGTGTYAGAGSQNASNIPTIPGGQVLDLPGVGNAIFQNRYTLASQTIATLSDPSNFSVRNTTNYVLSNLISPTNGDDTIIGTAAGDPINLLDGNDTFTGAGGADIIQGGAGNDRFIVALPTDMIAGESIDGGADIDVIEFADGAHSLVGVTLTNVEQIKLTGTTATTLALASASQALLFTSTASANDTVTFTGDFTPAQLAALAAAGVDTVDFVSNGNGITATYTDLLLRQIIVDDDNNNDTFSRVTVSLDTAGVTTALATNFDNSINEVISFAGGLKTTTVKTDTAGGTEQVWTQQTFTFTPAGALASLDQDNDDGSAQRVEYGAGGVITRNLTTQVDDDTYDLRYNATGTLTQSVFTDLSLTAPFTSYTNDFTGGALSKSTTVFDNGLRTVTNVSSGLKTSYEQYDDADVFSYSSLLTTYAANGSTIVSTVYTQDSGARSHHAGVGGATLTGNSANDSMTGALGAADVFVFAPGGGNDYVSNFQDGVDVLNLSSFGFADFAAVRAITVANGANGIYLTFGANDHLAINGVSLANFSASDVIV